MIELNSFGLNESFQCGQASSAVGSDLLQCRLQIGYGCRVLAFLCCAGRVRSLKWGQGEYEQCQRCAQSEGGPHGPRLQHQPVNPTLIPFDGLDTVPTRS